MQSLHGRKDTRDQGSQDWCMAPGWDQRSNGLPFLPLDVVNMGDPQSQTLELYEWYLNRAR